MEKEIHDLLEDIKEDYFNWTSGCAAAKGRCLLSDINKTMIAKFNDNLSVKYGSKYIKIINNNSVWGFVVNTDKDKKFAKGDILKAAGWASPARNAARGNILDGGYTIRWTGPLYL